MPGFMYQPLLWGLLLVGLPVLIHLINMLRHRRVHWAAMEFLLQSQRRNRTWILFTQLLLLLLRMAAIAAVVLAFAQPLLTNRFGRLLGGAKTEHIVLLDDSYSMSDRWADTNAFELAKTAVRRIGEQAARQSQPQSFTLLRYSRASDDPNRASSGGFDMVVPRVSEGFRADLDETLEGIAPSGTDAGPLPAVDTAERLVQETTDARRIVYLVSDFRSREWNDPRELRQRLAKLEADGCELHLIDCADDQRANLAITQLRAEPGTRAAGVPLFVEVAVRNFANTTARDVAVSLEENGTPRPAVRIAEIPPGETVRERFLVHFPTAGRQRLVASLQGDAVAADNTRYLTLDIPLDVPTLLIDDERAEAAQQLALVLAPGGRAKTGVRPVIETPRYLTVHPLDDYRVIYLLDVPQLEPSAVAALEQFVREGGGLAFFVGEKTRAAEINRSLDREGQGLFPAPLLGVRELPVDRLTRAPDLSVGDHPIFRVFAGQRNPFLDMVRVERYFAVDDQWEAPEDSGVEVLAELRGGSPLVLQKRYGEGRTLAFLTTLDPTWNNWGRNNPSYVVTLLESQAFLARRAEGTSDYRVGATPTIEFPAGQYQSKVQLRPPGTEPGSPPLTADAVPTPDGSQAVELEQTGQAGFYGLQLQHEDGTLEARSLAFNVEPEEGDLAMLGGDQLAERLTGIDYEFSRASSFQFVLGEAAGYNLAEALLYVVVVLLILEQLLAWWASYHPAAPRPALAGGGAQ